MQGQIAVKRHESEMKPKHIAENKKYLDELFSKLKDADIKAVIITTPCFSSYYTNINSKKYLRMQNEIKSLSQKYNVEYHNYLKDNRFTIEDFFDSDHLNARGAEKFSNILKNDIVEKYFSLP